MGKFTIEKWQCDRCGTVMDKRPYRSERAHYEVRISVDYGTAGGSEIDWREMCDECDHDVEDDIKAMKDAAKARRAAINAKQGGE